MPEQVQKELLKLHGIEFHGNIIIIEEATFTRIKRPDEQNPGLLRNRLTKSHIQRSTTEVVYDSSENVDFKRKKYLVTNRMLMLLCHVTRKTLLPKK